MMAVREMLHDVSRVGVPIHPTCGQQPRYSCQ